MSHTVTFNDSEADKELLRRIDEYQKRNNLPSRVEAVRQLCDIALCSKELMKKLGKIK